MMQLGKEIKDYWQSQIGYLREGASEEDILNFEDEHNIILPQDMKDYFLTVNGMIDTIHFYQDKKGFHFWMLDEIKNYAEAGQEAYTSWIKTLPNAENFFLFADVLDWCWAYAIRLASNVSKPNEVMLVCCSNPIKIADSFSEFIKLYFEDSHRIYPPEFHIHS